MDMPNLGPKFALDLETKDDGLANGYGPGWVFPRDSGRGGYIVGFAVANEENPDGIYLPIRHEAGGNMEEDVVLKYIQEQIKQAETLVVANGQYEVGWMRREGIPIDDKKIDDVLVQAPLLWEHDTSYSLDNVAWKYLKKHKREEELIEATKRMIGGRLKKNAHKTNLWRLPAEDVREYGEFDAAVTWELENHLKPQIEEDELSTVYKLETDIIPLLVEMRWRGVRVDLGKADHLRQKFLDKENELLEEIRWRTGYTFKPSDPKTAAPILKEAGITVPKTPKTGKDSVTADWLESLGGEMPEMIIKIRKVWKARTTFIENFVQDFEYDGRVHSELKSVKGESGGTVGGRFASSNPNLQQIPARDPEIGPLIRSMYLPEEGEQWAAVDFSSQEPRLTVHYASIANVTGGYEAAQKFLNDPDTDYHQMVADLCGIPRKDAKAINLGLTYGMGGGKLCQDLGLPTAMKSFEKADGTVVEYLGPGEEGEALLNKYHENAPFIGALIKKVKRTANKRGYVKTILGRRCHFPMKNGRYDFTHKALNRIIQGSAADFTKKAMLDLWEEGVVPMVSVHDELGFSVKNKEEAVKYADVMCKAIELEIPMKSDIEIGINWGSSMVGEDI